MDINEVEREALRIGKRGGVIPCAEYIKASNLNEFNKAKLLWKLRFAYYQAYPDIWYYHMRDKNAPYNWNILTAIRLRAMATFKNSIFASCVRTFKSFNSLMSLIHDATFTAHRVLTEYAPTKGQMRDIAQEVYRGIVQNFPTLEREYTKYGGAGEDIMELKFKNGSVVRTTAPLSTVLGRGDMRQIVEEYGTDEFPHSNYKKYADSRLSESTLVDGVPFKFVHNMSRALVSSMGRRDSPFWEQIQRAFKEIARGESTIVLPTDYTVAIALGRADEEYFKQRKYEQGDDVFSMNYLSLPGDVTSESLFSGTILKDARVLTVAEYERSKPTDVYYLGCDVASAVSGNNNAYTALVVGKVYQPEDFGEYGEYAIDVVYGERFNGEGNDKTSVAKRITELDNLYNFNLIAIDNRGGGEGVIQRLIEGAGEVFYGCTDGRYSSMTRMNAKRIIRPISAARGSRAVDTESNMITDLQNAMRHRRIRILGSWNDCEYDFKKRNRIKDDAGDVFYKRAYDFCDILTDEMANVAVRRNEKTQEFEDLRIHLNLQKDTYSALKYLRRCVKEFEDRVKQNMVWESDTANEFGTDFINEVLAFKR